MLRVSVFLATVIKVKMDKENALHKIHKPSIEKKRRERMNTSIKTLRALIRDTISRDTSPLTRVDKAEVLELTVRHLQEQQQQQQHAAISMVTQSSAAAAAQRAAFDAGFQDGAREIINFMSSRQLLDERTLHCVSNHLNEIRVLKPAQRMRGPYPNPMSNPVLGIVRHPLVTHIKQAAIPSQNFIPRSYTEGRLPVKRSAPSYMSGNSDVSGVSMNSASSSTSSSHSPNDNRSGDYDWSENSSHDEETEQADGTDDAERNTGPAVGMAENANGRIAEQNGRDARNENSSALWRPW